MVMVSAPGTSPSQLAGMPLSLSIPITAHGAIPKKSENSGQQRIARAVRRYFAAIALKEAKHLRGKVQFGIGNAADFGGGFLHHRAAFRKLFGGKCFSGFNHFEKIGDFHGHTEFRAGLHLVEVGRVETGNASARQPDPAVLEPADAGGPPR